MRRSGGWRCPKLPLSGRASNQAPLWKATSLRDRTSNWEAAPLWEHIRFCPTQHVAGWRRNSKHWSHSDRSSERPSRPSHLRSCDEKTSPMFAIECSNSQMLFQFLSRNLNQRRQNFRMEMEKQSKSHQESCHCLGDSLVTADPYGGEGPTEAPSSVPSGSQTPTVLVSCIITVSFRILHF